MNEYQRFKNKLEFSGDCWIWMGAKTRFGYGHFRRFLDNRWKMFKTHRYSYEIHHGEIPGKMLVLHTCDIPACCNPDHLFLGTHLDNTQDMVNKGRKRFGRNTTHKWLSLEIAESFRKYAKENQHLSQKEMANTLNTSVEQLNRIINNKIWVSPEGEN